MHCLIRKNKLRNNCKETRKKLQWKPIEPQLYWTTNWKTTVLTNTWNTTQMFYPEHHVQWNMKATAMHCLILKNELKINCDAACTHTAIETIERQLYWNTNWKPNWKTNELKNNWNTALTLNPENYSQWTMINNCNALSNPATQIENNL